MELFKKIKINVGRSKEREIRFSGIPIFQYGKKETNGECEKYFEILPKSFEHKFLDKIIKQLDDNYDYVILMRASGLGEIYSLGIFIREMISNAGAKKTCIVSHYNPPLVNACKLIMPDIPIIVTDELSRSDFNSYIKESKIMYKGITFQCFHCILDDAISLIDDRNIHNESYLTRIGKYIGCQNLNQTVPLLFDNEAKDAVNLLSGINLNKFVIFLPEANFFAPLSKDFWTNLAAEFRKKGYDIYVNKTEGLSDNLTVSQLVYLSSFCKGIVALRCGLLEFMSRFNIPKHILYTSEKATGHSEGFIPLFTLKKYPDVIPETVFEYEAEKYSDKILVQEIIKDF